MRDGTIETVGLIPNPERETTHVLARRTVERVEARGARVLLMASDAKAVDLEGHGAPDLDAFRDAVDVVVSLGGDGTMLHAVDVVYDAGIPVLGVNVGRLGYLTEVDGPDLDDALDRLLDGRFHVNERMVLRIAARVGDTTGAWWALNELTLEKVHPGRTVRLDVAINGRAFTTYTADGVIVATPTGSTAYSFSARGPIVSPEHRCMLLTPVSPHMLFDRSLVLGPEEQLRFEVAGDQPVYLTADGQEAAILSPGDSIQCTGGRRPARIVGFEPRDFHQILKAKFGLADR